MRNGFLYRGSEVGRWKKAPLAAAAVGLVAVVTGCGPAAAPVAEETAGVHPTMVGLPDWVLRGGAAFPEDKGQAIYGVGSFSAPTEPEVARAAVDARARRHVARTLDTFVASVMKDYAKSAIADWPALEGGGQLILVAQNITKAVMVDFEIVERHRDEQLPVWYALAKLEMDGVAAAIREEVARMENTRDIKLKIEAAEAREELDRIIRDAATEMY